jgi:phage terminase large subunit-like protein
MNEDDLSQLASIVRRQIEEIQANPVWRPLPHQIPPAGDDWMGWLLLGGRGCGKTDCAAEYVAKHVNGPPCTPGPIPHYIGVVAPTLGDAATSCFSGVSGIYAHDPTSQLVTKPGGLLIQWPNGSQAKLFGAREPDDVERLRAGGGRCLDWYEEAAAWRYMDDAFDQASFGLRVGPHPRWVCTTTPKPRPLIKRMVKGELRNIVIVHATMFDNPYLPQHIRDALEDRYAGTSLGAQELYGRLVEQDENALWTRENIEKMRIDAGRVPDLRKITVGVDPSGGTGFQGIVVAGASRRIDQGRTINEGWTLADYTVHMDPDGWGRRAVTAAVDFEADDIVVEINFGGDMAVATIVGAADAMGISIPVRTERASRGKRPRAEPIAALSTRERWHYAGVFPELEDELCTWTPEADYSPDRLDALVWGGWHMKLAATMFLASGSFPGIETARRNIGGQGA